MTTRKEKFNAARKKMLAQTDREVEVEEEEEEEEENFETAYTVDDPIFGGDQKKFDQYKQDLHDAFDDDGDREAYRARQKEKEKKAEKEVEWQKGLRQSYNFFCWIATLALAYSTYWCIHLFLSAMFERKWQFLDGIIECTFVIVVHTAIGLMVSGMFFFGISTILFILGINYWGWLANGMNPKAFK